MKLLKSFTAAVKTFGGNLKHWELLGVRGSSATSSTEVFRCTSEGRRINGTRELLSSDLRLVEYE